MEHRTVRPLPVGASWTRQTWPIRILRAFLGGTFVYAGIQKLADPNFLHPGTSAYIGEQLSAFGQGSPLHPLFAVLGHVPALAGILIAVTEIAVGLGTLLGIAPLIWAAAGLVINLILFMSATWHVHPYFLGSDSMYAVAWAAYGAGVVEAGRQSRRAALSHGTRRERAASTRQELGRRQFIRGAILGIGSLLIGAGAAVAAGGPSASALRTPPSPSPQLGNRTPVPSAPGTTVTHLDQLPVGKALNFMDPGQGPSVLVRLAQDRVAAFSRVCTHAGCLVEYDSSARLLYCPCHGAEFDPVRGAVPVAGPAPTALPAIPVRIDPITGAVVALS